MCELVLFTSGGLKNIKTPTKKNTWKNTKTLTNLFGDGPLLVLVTLKSGEEEEEEEEEKKDTSTLCLGSTNCLLFFIFIFCSWI